MPLRGLESQSGSSPPPGKKNTSGPRKGCQKGIQDQQVGVQMKDKERAFPPRKRQDYKQRCNPDNYPSEYAQTKRTLLGSGWFRHSQMSSFPQDRRLQPPSMPLRPYLEESQEPLMLGWMLCQFMMEQVVHHCSLVTQGAIKPFDTEA